MTVGAFVARSVVNAEREYGYYFDRRPDRIIPLLALVRWMHRSEK